jgi:hypothetical protein
MSGVPEPVFTSEAVSLTWRDDDAGRTEALTCWFERSPIRHIVRKHVHSQEPWGRILDRPLLERLVRAVETGNVPAASDFAGFVRALKPQLESSCARPLLCRFHETGGPGGSPRYGVPTPPLATSEKFMFVLPSGAVAFVRVNPAVVAEVTVTVLLTAFFPKHTRGWVAPARAAAATVDKYLLRWAEYGHHTGGRLLPEPEDTVDAQDETTGRATRRGNFRFVSLKNWGFRRKNDSRWVWPGPA